MKKIIQLVIIIGMVSFGPVVFAQKAKIDPAFSSSNYKHQNKARAAEQMRPEGTQAQKEEVTDVYVRENYKAQNRVTEKRTLFVLPGSGTSGQAFVRNYKQQFAPTQRKNTDVAPFENDTLQNSARNSGR